MWDYLVGVGIGFVDGVLFVFVGGVDVVEGGFYFIWWGYVLEVYVGDYEVGVVVV